MVCSGAGFGGVARVGREHAQGSSGTLLSLPIATITLITLPIATITLIILPIALSRIHNNS